MMAVIYWWGASAFMIDKSVMDLTPAAAVATSIGVILLGWFVYDGICRVPLRYAQRDRPLRRYRTPPKM
jgi:uncharacterized membrane protein